MGAEEDPGMRLIEEVQNPGVDFLEAYERAKEAGATETKLLLGKMLYYLQAGDIDRLLNMTGQLEDAADSIDYGMGKVFSSRSEFLGLVQTLKAVGAYRDEDLEAFESLVKEAYWLWPQYPDAFGLGDLIFELRVEEIREAHLSELTVPMDTTIRNLDGSTVDLATLIEGKKAILFDFWASWCGPCIRLMPELVKKHEVLAPQGVVVAGLNTDDEEPLTEAQQTREAHGMEMPWLVEDEAQTMSDLLMINSIPHMALIAPDGRLLWSGHPMDDSLETALEELGVSLSPES